ncbi:MAG: glycosyltransferase family 39 protein [Lachnospiraceae bacterium]|nr:glycosyltransferase family 39 protein [Lachnospiraceae bacterium]
MGSMNKENEKNKSRDSQGTIKWKWEDMILPLLTIVLLVINGIRIFNSSISGDEGFSLMLAKMSMGDMLTATAADVHPPLYYIMIMFFGKVTGYTAVAGRVLSYLAIVTVAILANTYLKKRFGAYAAAIFFALLTFTNNAIEMIVEIRMYTWAMVFVLLTALFAYELMRLEEAYRGSLWKWAGLCVCGLAAGYLHYYALIMVVLIDLFLFMVLLYRKPRNILPCIVVSIASVIVYFPWLLVLIKQFGAVSNDYWISNIEVKDWIRYIFGEGRIGQILRITLLLSGLIFLVTRDGLQIETDVFERKKNVHLNLKWEKHPMDAERYLVLLCGLTTIGTIAVGAIVSYIFRPLYVSRYIYSAFGLITLAFGISFTHCSRRKVYTWILLIYILLFGSRSFMTQYQLERSYHNQTREAVAYIQENMKVDDIIVTDHSQLSWTVLDYYCPENEIITLGNNDLMAADFDECWYMNDGAELNEKIVAFEKQGLKVTKIKEMGIGRYPFTLYKLEK